jgi:hypothetical protein
MSREDAIAAQAYEDENQAPLAQDPKLGTWIYKAEDPIRSINYNDVALKYKKINPMK